MLPHLNSLLVLICRVVARSPNWGWLATTVMRSLNAPSRRGQASAGIGQVGGGGGGRAKEVGPEARATAGPEARHQRATGQVVHILAAYDICSRAITPLGPNFMPTTLHTGLVLFQVSKQAPA
jgi:hypothetical protein